MGTGLVSEKAEALYAELYGTEEVATSSYSGTGEFYDMFILCLWLRTIIRSEFCFTDVFLYGCGFLLLLRKDAQNECALLKYCYSLSAAELNNIESGKEVFV